MGGPQECLYGWAEECLVHEFYTVAEVRDCVDVVHLVGRACVVLVMCWCGRYGETPESCAGVAGSSEEVLLAIVEVASSGIIGDSVAGITENRSGQKG